jgi:hypothetical protein
MSAARVVHFGQDECYRTPIMRAAGYDVAQCESIQELQTVLKSSEAADLICISESYHQPREDALAISRALSRAPVVLFRSTMHRYIADKFDLEIDTLAAPDIWLVHMDTLIAQSRMLVQRSIELQSASKRLREESAAAREKSQALRARIAEERGKRR